MLKLRSVGQIEHGEYAYEDATIASEIKNGAFGTVTGGAFATAATATKAVMNEEVGDDAYMDIYKIPSGSHVKVADLTKIKTFEAYGHPLPATYAKDNKLVSKADGTLEVKASATAPYFKVDEVIYVSGLPVGAVLTIVTA